MSTSNDRSLVQPGFYGWSALPTRSPQPWPNGASVAVSVILALEYLEETAAAGPFPALRPLGGIGVPIPDPDLPLLTHREYGVRVGVFRILQLLKELSVRPTVAIDAMTAEHYPFMVEYCASQGVDFVAHGISCRGLITAAMSETEERSYLADAIRRVSRATARSITGWLSPESWESERTPLLLPEHGIRYVCDWSNDDQPYSMSDGRLVSIPVMAALDDAYCMLSQQRDPDEYATILARWAETLREESKNDARCMVFVLHPWVSGQAFRIRCLASAIGHIVSLPGVWPCSTGELAEAARARGEAVSTPGSPR